MHMLLATQETLDADRLGDGPMGFPLSSATGNDRAAAPTTGSLTALEQSVVALSFFDHRSSIEPATLLARFFARACGVRPVNQLANDRLEALRRYGIVLRLSGGVTSVEEKDRLLAAGFTDSASDEIARLIFAGQLGAQQPGRAEQ